MKRRYIYLIISIAIALVILGLGLIPNASMRYFLWIFEFWGLLLVGGVVFILRLAHFISRETFVYILSGTINILLFLVSISLYRIGEINIVLPEMTLANLALGAILLTDAFLLKRNPYEKTETNR